MEVPLARKRALSRNRGGRFLLPANAIIAHLSDFAMQVLALVVTVTCGVFSNAGIEYTLCSAFRHTQ